jgi:ribosomal protein S18 acetylase RimI-like enzyme
MTKLVKMTKDHADFFLETRNHESSRKFMEFDKEVTQEQFYQIIENDTTEWMVIENKKPTGLLCAYEKDNKLFFGITIHPKQRRKGYARKAIRKFLEQTDELKEDVYLAVMKGNFAIKLYKSLGFKRTGVEEESNGRKFIQMKRKHQ